jgi:hypothetical protein
MRCVTAIVFAVILGTLSQPAQCAAADQWEADVPLLDCQGMPCIDATIGNGVTGRMLIDTGDLVSVVDMSDQARIGFGPEYMKDGKVAKAAHVSAAIGAVHLADVPVVPVELKSNIRKSQMPKSRGSLAYTAFKGRVLQLDFPHRRLRLSAPLSAPRVCTGACATLSLITFGQKGPPIVVADGFSIGGQSLTAQIDSLYSGGLLIYNASIDKLGLSRQADTKATVLFPFTDGGVRMRTGGSAALSFAGKPVAPKPPLYFPTPGVHEPDALFDGTVGLALMKRDVVTFDFYDKTFSITG